MGSQVSRRQESRPQVHGTLVGAPQVTHIPYIYMHVHNNKMSSLAILIPASDQWFKKYFTMFTNMHKYCLLTWCYIRFEAYTCLHAALLGLKRGHMNAGICWQIIHMVQCRVTIDCSLPFTDKHVYCPQHRSTGINIRIDCLHVRTGCSINLCLCT